MSGGEWPKSNPVVDETRLHREEGLVLRTRCLKVTLASLTRNFQVTRIAKIVDSKLPEYQLLQWHNAFDM